MPAKENTPPVLSNAIRSLPDLRHWRSATNSLLWSCGIGLAPIWMSAVIFAALGQFTNADSLLNQGQLALFAATMSWTAMYLTSIDREPPGMRLRSPILFIASLAVIGAIGIYAASQTVTTLTTELDIPFTVPTTATLIVSAIVCILALIGAFLATLIDNERLDTRFASYQQQHESTLRADFHETDQ